MKNIRFFLSENFHFLVVKFSVYLNRLVFVMSRCNSLAGVCTVCCLVCHSVSMHIFVSYHLFTLFYITCLIERYIFLTHFFEKGIAVYIGLDNVLFSTKTYLYFSYFSTRMCLWYSLEELR